ncbi:hypothetical protein OM416_20325 [Paenibacillus sp. LS1]|uniref:hypothetical protein n=1 Tax=Paenibacillus sp. LS1 TaxID=2992120 RepID=UPI00223063EA|nr:hypothetical protein [Paenibacillus sp. LS1]MCW3793944.1 hypothetical protein [Paenibacillus sp. LS1]
MQNNNDKTLHILIASQNPEFANSLKLNVEKLGHKVVETVMLSDHLFEALENNKDLPLDGIIMTSDLAQRGSDKRLDVLSDTLLTVRNEYSSIAITILSNESAGHPFLFELISCGIYNIFLQQSSINVQELINSLVTPKNFQEVSHYREVNESIRWRKINRGANEVLIKRVEQTVNGTETQKTTSESTIQLENNTANKTVPSKRNLVIDDDIENFEIAFPAAKERIVIKNKIIGTVVIGVVGVISGIGTTHSAISLSGFLSRKGNRVALVECNRSEDFDYIELTYEGIKDGNYSLQTSSFQIDGVDYFKSTHMQEDIVSLLSQDYNFVVLDLGNYRDTSYFEEFLRADIQIVVGSGIEYKLRHLKDFFLENEHVDNSFKWNVFLPLTDNQTKNDVTNDLSLEKVHVIPQHIDPFKSRKELDLIFEEVIEATSDQNLALKSKHKRTLIALGICIIVTIVLLIKMIYS